MPLLLKKSQDLVRKQAGQTLVEYTVLIAVIALGAVAALSTFQGVISNVWTAVSSNLAGGS